MSRSSEGGDPELQNALSDRIRQLELEKLSNPEYVDKRLNEFQDKHAFSEEDFEFVKTLAEGWCTHVKEIEALKADVQRKTRKEERLGQLCRTLQEKNKQQVSWREEMQGQLDKSLKEVMSKISLYEEENSNILKENTNLRNALQKAVDYNSKRGEHCNALQKTNDFMREKHDEMDKKYTDICNEYSKKLEQVTKDHDLLKQRYREQVGQNQELKKNLLLLSEKIKQDKETRDMVDEFDSKYKVLLEESNKCIEQYKTYNDKLQKQNKIMKNKAHQSATKCEKFKAENKEFKKKNGKLNKKVSTLSNLCRELQGKIKSLQESKVQVTAEENTV